LDFLPFLERMGMILRGDGLKSLKVFLGVLMKPLQDLLGFRHPGIGAQFRLKSRHTFDEWVVRFRLE